MRVYGVKGLGSRGLGVVGVGFALCQDDLPHWWGCCIQDFAFFGVWFEIYLYKCSPCFERCHRDKSPFW